MNTVNMLNCASVPTCRRGMGITNKQGCWWRRSINHAWPAAAGHMNDRCRVYGSARQLVRHRPVSQCWLDCDVYSREKVLHTFYITHIPASIKHWSKTPALRCQFLFHNIMWMVLGRRSNESRKFVDQLNGYPLIQKYSAPRRQLKRTTVKATGINLVAWI